MHEFAEGVSTTFPASEHHLSRIQAGRDDEVREGVGALARS